MLEIWQFPSSYRKYESGRGYIQNDSTIKTQLQDFKIFQKLIFGSGLAMPEPEGGWHLSYEGSYEHDVESDSVAN